MLTDERAHLVTMSVGGGRPASVFGSFLCMTMNRIFG